MKDNILWTALITPFTDSGEIDSESFAMLVERQMNAGNGVLVHGSTGEPLSLTQEEKNSLLDTALSTAKSVPVMVGVEGHSLRESLEWIEYLNDKPIEAYLLVAPSYTRPGPLGQRDWFLSLLEKSKRPCMIYNIPARSGVSLDVGALESINSHPNFWGLKEASGSLDYFHNCRKVLRQQKLYSGDDGLLPHLALDNANGLISVIGNAWPKWTREIVENSLNLSLTVSNYQLWRKATYAMGLGPNPVSIKSLMAHAKILPSGHLRSPLHPDDCPNLSELILYHEEIKKRGDAQ